ncbi:beta-galactosidase [Sphaerisporangium corydalis]|uniref:beta-galactosidase n=1 Tax=Sphaerisporangium corydalis TaxID=1441875 RepID=A0ABV9EKT7_9ACTN|nr:beta-galactosidase [Sphaerisporangium corydalis]
MRWPEGLDGLCYGGDYNPEQWPEEVWHEDVALMREAGVTLVTVGVFSWASLEPAPGRLTFDRLDRVLGLLDAGGVRVALATPTASPPPWFGLAHPDALPVSADGTRLTHGSRDTYCVCAPAYQEASARIVRALAERYRDHPALAMWHVHNEYGTWCHCDHAAAAFRAWLRARHGSLDALNDAWTTAFWGQGYGAWEEVMPPRATQYLPNPSQALDFRRFLSDATLGHFRAQKAILRELTPGVPVTTNLAYGDWVPVNPWEWAGEVDLIAVDHYPPDREHAAEHVAFAADLARGWAGGRPWLLMEQAAGIVYTGPRMLPKRPGEIALHSVQHVARGSRGAMFFQWRASRGGSELWHGGMVPHAGPGGRVFREIRDLGRLLPRLAEVPGEARVVAGVAILWDPECWWALSAPAFPSSEVSYLEEVRQAHRVLWRGGVTTDFARPSGDLSAYRAVLVPSLYLISDADAGNLAAYVERGGTLVVSFFSGVADEHARVRLGGYPGALRDLLGIRVEEFLPLDAPAPILLDFALDDALDVAVPDSAAVAVASGTGTGSGADGRTGGGRGLVEGTLWSERVEALGATVLARYERGVLDGLPAVTRHRHGAGQAFYLSTHLDDAAYATVLSRTGALPSSDVLAGGDAEPGAGGLAGGGALVPAGLELVWRGEEGAGWLFALNHTAAEQTVTVSGTDLVTGLPTGGALRLAPGGFAVIRAHVAGATAGPARRSGDEASRSATA